MESLNIFIRSIFIDNMVFAFFFGMCSYIAVSKSVKTALGLGAAVTFVMVMTVPLNYFLYEYVLKAGALAWAGLPDVNLDFLTFIVFIATIAAFVRLVEMAVEKFSPTLYSQLGIFLPLIAVNCAIMGGSLFMQQKVDALEHVALAVDRLRSGLRSGLVAGYRDDGRDPREDDLLADSCGAQGAGYRLYHHRPDGYRLHDLLRYSVLTLKEIRKTWN